MILIKMAPLAHTFEGLITTERYFLLRSFWRKCVTGHLSFDDFPSPGQAQPLSLPVDRDVKVSDTALTPDGTPPALYHSGLSL